MIKISYGYFLAKQLIINIKKVNNILNLVPSCRSNGLIFEHEEKAIPGSDPDLTKHLFICTD